MYICHPINNDRRTRQKSAIWAKEPYISKRDLCQKHSPTSAIEPYIYRINKKSAISAKELHISKRDLYHQKSSTSAIAPYIYHIPTCQNSSALCTIHPPPGVGWKHKSCQFFQKFNSFNSKMFSILLLDGNTSVVIFSHPEKIEFSHSDIQSFQCTRAFNPFLDGSADPFLSRIQRA